MRGGCVTGQEMNAQFFPLDAPHRPTTRQFWLIPIFHPPAAGRFSFSPKNPANDALPLAVKYGRYWARQLAHPSMKCGHSRRP